MGLQLRVKLQHLKIGDIGRSDYKALLSAYMARRFGARLTAEPVTDFAVGLALSTSSFRFEEAFRESYLR